MEQCEELQPEQEAFDVANPEVEKADINFFTSLLPQRLHSISKHLLKISFVNLLPHLSHMYSYTGIDYLPKCFFKASSYTPLL